MPFILSNIFTGGNLIDKYPFPPSSCDDAFKKYVGLRTDIFAKYGGKEQAASKISAEEVKLSEAFESSLKNCGVPDATVLAIRNTPEMFSASTTPQPTVTSAPIASQPTAPAGSGSLDNILGTANNGGVSTATPGINTGIVPPGTGGASITNTNTTTGNGLGAGSGAPASDKNKIPTWAWWAIGTLGVVLVGAVVWKFSKKKSVTPQTS